jgi:flagellar hook assembly protein FlgD
VTETINVKASQSTSSGTTLITSVSVSPETLKPNTEGTTVSTIDFTLSADAVVSAGIYNSSNTLVKTLFNSTAVKGSNSLSWDGKDSTGALVGKGVYTYRITAQHPIESIQSSVLGTITIDFDLKSL